MPLTESSFTTESTCRLYRNKQDDDIQKAFVGQESVIEKFHDPTTTFENRLSTDHGTLSGSLGESDNDKVQVKPDFQDLKDEVGQVKTMREPTIIGAGTSSVVYLVGQQHVEKRFKSMRDLLNERIIYEILGSHPRLVPIRIIGPDCIFMDWMENGDLARFIKSHPEIARCRKYQWIEQIAESFSLLHAHHISHYDSKLENFLVDKDYDIRICDFASSHNCEAPSQDLAIQPSRYRRAVDDFDEATFNPADDIFAFGSICYEIITGGPVYPQLDDDSVSHNFAQQVFPATEDLRFGDIISGCWMGTFASFDTIRSALERKRGDE